MIIKNKLYTPLQHTLAQKRVNIKSSSPVSSIAKIVNELHVKIFNGDIPLQKISPINLKLGGEEIRKRDRRMYFAISR